MINLILFGSFFVMLLLSSLRLLPPCTTSSPTS